MILKTKYGTKVEYVSLSTEHVIVNFAGRKTFVLLSDLCEESLLVINDIKNKFDNEE